ncbi:MAG: DMT family transporter [Ktedonobacterales bacterium]
MRITSRTSHIHATTTRDTSGSRLWMIMLAAVLWGTVGVTTQTLYHTSAANPLSVGFFRMALATPVLALTSRLLVGRHIFRIAWRDLGSMMVIGLMLALYQACFFGAIVYIGVAIATLVTLSVAPILVALLSVAITRERPTRPVTFALVCALVGIACLVGLPSSAGQREATVMGVSLAFGSALGYAIVTLAARVLAGRYHTLQINTIAFGTGALVLLPVALLSGFVVTYPAQGWLLLVYLGVVPSALGYALFLTGMRSTPATVATIVTLLEPLTATLLAWVFFGERLTALGAVGALLLLGALVVLSLSQREGRKEVSTISVLPEEL